MMRFLIGFLGICALAPPAMAQVQGEETRWCGGYGEPHPDILEAEDDYEDLPDFD